MIGITAADGGAHVSKYASRVSSPRVSVILVSYNQSPFLRIAVDSVLRQTFEDYEVIILDDGSLDGSIEIIQDLVERHFGKLRFCHHPNHENRGICRTYMLGIREARCPYVAFLEGDDFWEPGYLENKVNLLDRFPEVGVVFSPYKIVSSGLYGLDMALRQRWLGLFMPRNIPFDNLKNLMRKNNIATFSAFITRRSLLEQISLCLPEGILYFDWWVLFQLGMRAKFMMDSASHIHWRHHAASTLGAQNLEQHKDMLCQFMQRMYEMLGREMDQLTEQNRIRYRENRSALPRFLSFYQQPCPGSFLGLFRVAPVWSMDSLASFFVNYWKYSR
jgi:glycosyltransferase involved in cell wall biosynthesis